MSRFRPRISLLNVLLITSIVALALLAIRQWQAVKPLRQEVQRLRTELGYLVIGDPGKVHAIQGQPIETVEPNRWRWRLFLPQGGQYSLNVFSGHLPPRVNRASLQEFEAAKREGRGKLTSRKLTSGELTLDVKLVNAGGRWILWTIPGGSHRVEPAFEWLGDRDDVMALFQVGQKQKTKEPGERVMLMYIPKPTARTNEAGRSVTHHPNGDVDGMVVWLEPQPAPENDGAAAATRE
jgi:hypothetical protein